MRATNGGVRTRRDRAFHIRATSYQQELIDKAAQALSKTRSEFMLESSCNAAEDVLMDRVNFTLTDDQLDEFERILDSPAPPNDALREFVRKRAPWEHE